MGQVLCLLRDYRQPVAVLGALVPSRLLPDHEGGPEATATAAQVPRHQGGGLCVLVAGDHYHVHGIKGNAPSGARLFE